MAVTTPMQITQIRRKVSAFFIFPPGLLVFWNQSAQG